MKAQPTVTTEKQETGYGVIYERGSYINDGGVHRVEMPQALVLIDNIYISSYIYMSFHIPSVAS